MNRAWASGSAALALLACAGSSAVGQAPSTTQPAVVPPDTATDTVVLSRTDNTQTVEAADQSLLLTKHRREEHALVRRLIFIMANLTLTEPAATVGDAPPPQTCHWQYRSFLQRQLCFTSMSGQFACTQPEVTPLPDETHGEAAAPANAAIGFCNDVFRPAVNARVRLAGTLRDRSAELFATDQKAKVGPIFKAAGVAVAAEPTASAKR